ncbi:MAG: hypothetical protein KDA58_15870, partial [Planctomycetaceae bacterium]|nr:hypothetical protein [Planctomycetaceae bacterium]
LGRRHFQRLDQLVVLELRGLLINATHDTVVRLLPPLNVTADEVDNGCGIIADVLREMAEEAA